MSTNLELDFIRNQVLLDLRSSLVSLDQLLIVGPHDLKSNNLTKEFVFGDSTQFIN